MQKIKRGIAMKKQPEVVMPRSELESDLSQYVDEAASRQSSIRTLMDQMNAMSSLSAMDQSRVFVRVLPACNSEV